MKDQQLHPEDHIYLSGFTNTARAFFRLLFRLLDLLISSLISGRFIILVALLLGIAFGLYRYSGTSYQYKGTMLIRFNTLSPRTYGELLDQLNQLASTGSVKELSNALKVTPQTASAITAINSRTLYNMVLSDTNSQVRDRVFKITLTLQNDQTPADTLNQAFLNYLNTLPFVVSSRQKEKDIQTEKLAFINKELHKLDSANTLLSSVQAYTKNNNIVNPTGFYIQYLVQEKEAAQRMMAFEATAVSKVEGFRFIRDPGEISWKAPVIKYGAIALFLGVLLSFIITVRRKLMTP